jgi:subtilisin family serine protease
MNVTDLWEALGEGHAGAGVSIAIVDSGICIDHPMFRADGMTAPPGFPLGSRQFTNSKVIVARSYHQLFPVPPLLPGQQTPDDEDGHGTAVAAVAAGRETLSPQFGWIRGIAPRAWLGNYKIFGTGVNADSTTAAVVAAVDQAVADGMDVLNLSFGGRWSGDPKDPELEAVRNAVAAGVIVVVAAGNNGPSPGTITSPGIVEEAVTVGAVTHGRRFAPVMEVQGPELPDELRRLPYTPGAEVTIPAPFGPLPLRSLTSLDPTRLACSSFPPGSLAGGVALVRRGECFFQEKLDHVIAAGAVGMVIYNNVDAPEVIMAVTNSPVPAVMISQRSGEALQAWLDFLPPTAVQVTLGPDDQYERFPAQGDQLVDFSSRGPGPGGTIKPELTAVGASILTAVPPSGFTMSAAGTSFATPMVSGAAALLRQLHPEWTPHEIKAVLVGTAAPVVTVDGRPARIHEAGVGRLDLASAASVPAVTDPATLVFSPTVGGSTVEQTLFVRNVTSAKADFSVRFQPRRGPAGMQVTVSPAGFMLASGKGISLTVRCQLQPGSSGGEMEGHLEVWNARSGVPVRVPTYCSISGSESGRTLKVSADGIVAGAFATVQGALGVARAGDVIEIADDEAYFETIVIGMGQDGRPLDGLVLRGTSTPKAALDGSQAAASLPVVTVSGAHNVKIENLAIRGGGQGVHFQDASGSVSRCSISTRSAGGGAHGIHVEPGSSVILEGNLIRDLGGMGVNVDGGDALLVGNTLGDRQGYRPVGYHAVRVQNNGAATLFDNDLYPGGTATLLRHGLEIRSSKVNLLQGNLVQRAGGHGDGAYLTQESRLDSVESRFFAHQGNGVLLENASGSSLFDEFFNNTGSGLQTLSNSRIGLASGHFLNNGVGILANGGELTVTNTVIGFSSSEGMRVLRPRNFRLAFGTVAQNGGLGVDVQGAFEGRIENSIFADNTGIDLSATGPVPVFGSLIGRAGRTTTLAAGNLVGRDPRFLNSAGGNYRPLFNSPAIDAGVFPTVTVKPWDFSGRLRIVDGDGDGDPRPDAGAFEFASEYAGRWILPLGADEFTGVAVVNAASSRFSGETVLRVHFREGKNSDRPVPRTADFFIGREKQNAATLSELFPSSPPRWVEVSPEHPFMAGFTLTGDMALKRLDGFVLSPPTESPLTLLGLSDPNPLRRIHLVNPGVGEVKVLASWMADTGTIHREVTMPPREAVTLDLDELVPERRDPGFLRLSTLPPTQPIHASVTSGDEQKRAVLPALSTSDAAAELFGAQFAVTDSIRTHIELVSLEGAVPVRISVFDEDGRLLGETTRTVRDSAPTEGDPGEWLGLNNVVGWIRVSSTALEAKLVGALTFRDPDGRLAATLPLQPMASAARVSVFSHVAEGDGNFTGITLLNPDPNATALLALEVYAPEGTLEGRYLGELCGRCKKARVLPEWVPAVAHRWGGWIRLRSNRPLLGFELFGNGDYLAAVPQQAIIR